MINFWQMQLHPGDSSWILEEIENILLNFSVIGMGIEWDNDRGAPNRFRNEVQIGDIVVIRHQGAPRYLVEVTGECKTNEGNNKLDVWFELFRKVKILSDKGEYYRDKYHTVTKQRWTDGLFAPTTFQTANNWNFAKYWYIDIINRNNMEKQDSNNSSKIQANIITVGNLLRVNNLCIPPYQRPYRWTENNVRQLLEDVQQSMNAGKKNYRIGSVILYNNKKENTLDNTLDIVDGQQRLTTLFLLWKLCGVLEGYSCPLSFGSESYESLKNNYAFIKEWLEENIGNDKKRYITYIFDACDFVKIVVDDLTEAFQMFDSQNGRGKDLEAYNLLKAYHIRAMEMESREEKIRCDKRWEEATQYDPTSKIKVDPNIDILKQLFNEQLYRSRVWSRQESAGEFSKKHIDEFKGFTIDKNHPAMFPYQNPQLLQYLTAKFYDTILSGTAATKNRFEYGDNEHINPFVNVNQQIVNGKDFFDYVETYVEIYKQMFINIGTYQLSEFKEFYYTHCLNYNWNEETYSEIKKNRKMDWAFKPSWPAARTGDSYLREAYKSLVFVLFDKFGEKGLNRHYKNLYRLIYSKRLQKSQVRYKCVADLPCEFFKIIVNAKDLADLAEIDKNAAKLSQEDYDATDKINNQTIINFIIGRNHGN